MTWYEIVIIAAAALFVLGVVIASVIRKKKGRTGCDCCGNCAGCSACRPPAQKDKHTQQSP